MGKVKYIALLLPLALSATNGSGQCANNNTVIAGGAITPPCPGSTTVPCVQGGQYALVNVVAGNIYTFSTCGATWDTFITLRNNTGGAVMGFNDDGCGLQSSVTWTSTYTGQLRVLVDQFPCLSNTICAPLVIACAAPPPPLPNDNPCGSIVVPVNTSCVLQNFTSTGSTITTVPPSPSCGVLAGGDVWFSFVAPASGLVIFETTAGTMVDAILAVYSATNCSTGFGEVGCDDDSGPGLMPYLSVTGLTPGVTYYARVFGFLGATGTFNMCLRTVVPPAGDCIYALNMYDSFGDGWNGSTVGVSINGGPFTNYTITGATGTALIGVYIGDVIVVQYTEVSPFPGEISYAFTPGCLWSDGPTPATGIVFTQTVDCQPAPAVPEDCAGAITICNNQAFNNNTSSTGCAADLDAGNQGCLSSAERQGTWYFFSPSTSGNIAMTLSPTNPADDYDFAIWGPFANSPICPPPGLPTRCSYSLLGGNTGMDYVALDNTETALGDKWVNDLTVIAGQIYIMYISNYSQSGLAFNLNWNLTNGASLDCTVLPVELTDFQANALATHVDLQWATASELNNDHFLIERSPDGTAFSSIGSVAGAGTSIQQTDYAHADESPLHGMNYYRLKQVDINGAFTYSNTVAVAFGGLFPTGLPYPNPANDAVTIDLYSTFTGMARLRALDATGRVVAEQVHELGIGPASLSLPMPGADAGAYSLKVIGPDGSSLRTGHFTVQ